MISNNPRSTWVLIAGLSGAGKTTALETFSDLGFYTIDNLPVPLFGHLLELARSNPEKYSRSALLLDIDSKEKQAELLERLKEVDRLNCRMVKLFVECCTETIIKRYGETRRPHPGVDPARDKTLADTIQRERGRLQPFKQLADFRLDTSDMSVHELRRRLRAFADELAVAPPKSIRLNFVSFGFKYGSPFDCDLLIDVRFLPNPYFVEDLRERTGLDGEVADYVLKSKEAVEFIERYQRLLEFLLPLYVFEGKAYLNIGIGCTGGKHRSVAIAQELSRRIGGPDYHLSVQHRDIER